MFDNLTKEIILLSMVPVILIILIDLIVFIVARKKKNNFRFNYFIKVSLIIAIAFVLPLIGGYTIWVISNFISRSILSKNIWYTGLLIFLWACLIVLLLWVYLKSLREFNERNSNYDDLEERIEKSKLEEENVQ